MKKFLFLFVIIAGTAILTSGSGIMSGKNALERNNNLIPQEKKTEDVKIVYTCPMHAEIVQDKAGKCPKCGMDLVKKEVKKETYSCPMHPEVTQDKPGKCPKCGMDLTLKKPEKKS